MDINWIFSDICLTFTLSTAASITGTVFYLKYKEHLKNRPLNQILNFGDDDIIFVFTHRDHVPESILPRTSTEDFMAMNNFISALIKVNSKNKFSVRDTGRLTDIDKKKNLVLICSAKSNKVTKEVQEILLKNRTEFCYHKKIDETEKWSIEDMTGIYPSETYDEINLLLEKGGKSQDITEHELNDVAMVTKITNPWNALNKIFIVAGVRGIGTWGAAECIKKEWKQIYDKLPKRKDTNFSALMRVKYKNCDIISLDTHHLLSIPQKTKL